MEKPVYEFQLYLNRDGRRFSSGHAMRFSRYKSVKFGASKLVSPKKRIFIGLMTSGRKLKASREGSK